MSFIDVELKEKKTNKNKEFPITNTLKKELLSYMWSYFNCFYGLWVEDGNLTRLSEEQKELVKNVIRTEPLFPSEKKGYLSRVQIYRILNSAAKKVGIENIGTHTMRKTFGYWFYKRTKDIGLLQKILNHSSPRETMIYIGLEQEEINEAYKSFGL